MPLPLGDSLLHESLIGERRRRRFTLMSLPIAVETGRGDIGPAVAATFASSGEMLSRQLETASFGETDTVGSREFFGELRPHRGATVDAAARLGKIGVGAG